MHFKKLELFGFKSFAERTVLNLEPGVTAVVGPNGCGKSNVLDSIRWAMGEQNPRDLRGSSMADVIFNGSDKKEPLNFAEVSLTLSNESRILPIEYDEVTLTRRLYRSGESEYLLNKTPVRLKDIADLFMDTGLGSGGFWTIEQGKIDMVLSAKAEDRRSVFEEASGINKYKTKKKEALRKLEQTEENLLRLSDIISEVRRQINSIERQAQKAKKYKELFEKLKAADLKLAQRSYGGLKNDRASLASARAQLQEKEKAIVADEARLNEALSSQRSKLDGLERELSRFTEECRGVSSAIERNADRAGMNRERITELKLRKENLSGEIESLKGKALALGIKVEQMRAELAQVEGEKASKEGLLAQQEKELRDMVDFLSRAQTEIAGAKFRVVEAASKESRAKNELTKLAADISHIAARIRRLEVERDKLQNEAGEVQAEYETALKEEEEDKKRLEEIRLKITSLDAALTSRLEGFKVTEKGLGGAESELAAKSARLESLVELHKRREGYSSGVRFLLQEKDSGSAVLSGVHGVVADLIEIDRGFEEAIESALGEDVQAIVVDSRRAAIDVMNHLSRANQGKAKFICLDELDGTASAVEIAASEAGNPALDYAKSGSRYDALLRYLLGGIYVAEDIESAVSIAKDKPPRKVVTKSGELLWGAVIAGGARQEAGFLGIKSKIKEIEGKVEELARGVEQLKAEKAHAAVEIDTLKGELQSEKSSSHEVEVALANKGSVLSAAAAQKKKVDDEYALISLELDEAREEESRCKSKEETQKSELIHLETAKRELENFISATAEETALRASRKEELLVSMAQMRAELGSVEERRLAQSAALDTLDASFESDTSSCAAKEKETQDSGVRIEELTQETADLESQNSGLSSKRADLEAGSQKLLEGKNELVGSISDCEAQRAAMQKECEQLRDAIRDNEVKDAQLGFEETSLKERMMQTYQVDLEHPPEAQEAQAACGDLGRTSEEDWESAGRQAEELREKVKAMGPVNLVAIEEESELATRYNFLTAQEADLLAAKDSLVKAIQKINKTTKELFLDGFQKVQVAFRDYFKMLFGGGEAELIILDESDVLESGIEIVVRPPGKKLQNITLLSGGEKALCAIALLFAIFKVRPSPFCILDEIDAPLDELNIGRFTRLLGEFVKTSQFIIITHNKKTISVADVMYGVTMEESGVSKIVSVKFQEAPANTA